MELIVLVDDDGREIGTLPKPEVHHGETPLHRAFSAYLFSDDGRLLITRRAEDKATFPGMWTNTVCGHPGPGEDDAAAIARRAREELGRSEEHTSELQSRQYLVCRLLLEKKNNHSPHAATPCP